MEPAFVGFPDPPDDEIDVIAESSNVLRMDAHICRLARLFTEARGEDVWEYADKTAERIQKTYSGELLDYIWHDEWLTTGWSVEKRMEMVEERTREFRLRKTD